MIFLSFEYCYLLQFKIISFKNLNRKLKKSLKIKNVTQLVSLIDFYKNYIYKNNKNLFNFTLR